MSKIKSGQFAVGCMIILALFVSSVAACICSHHTEEPEIETSSCHGHSKSAPDRAADSTENFQTLDSNDECCCLQPAPRAFSKSETITIEKQTAALPFSQTECKTVSPVVSGSRVYFEKPFYFSDFFYNLKSPRAPPAA